MWIADSQLLNGMQASLHPLRSCLHKGWLVVILMLTQFSGLAANETKAELDKRLAEVKRNNETIQARIQNVQDKVRQITCPFPDDLILQVFISELANKVEMRKANV